MTCLRGTGRDDGGDADVCNGSGGGLECIGWAILAILGSSSNVILPMNSDLVRSIVSAGPDGITSIEGSTTVEPCEITSAGPEPCVTAVPLEPRAIAIAIAAAVAELKASAIAGPEHDAGASAPLTV